MHIFCLFVFNIEFLIIKYWIYIMGKNLFYCAFKSVSLSILGNDKDNQWPTIRMSIIEI